MILPATVDPNGPLDDTIGALYIGTLLSAVLYGVIILQTFHYFTKYRRETWSTKTAVITLIALDTTHMFFLGSLVYHYVIANYHDPSKLPYLVWQIPCAALLVVANSVIVQVFFIYRIFRLSQSRVLCAFFLFLVCCQAGVGISWAILTWQKKKHVELAPILPVAITCSVLTSLIDILIAGSLCVLLHRARTGFKRSDTTIDRLILFVISTGSLTSICAIAIVINMVALPFTLIFASLHFCLGRLYTNSFLATLNARSIIGENMELMPSSIHRGTRGTTASKSRNINILIETTQEIGRDRVETTRDSMATNGHIESVDDSLPKRVGSL